MNFEETWGTIYTILEEGTGSTADHTADLLMEALEVMGEDVLDHLDPPVGLKRWLDSHGLSLVPTREVTPPRVWSVLDGDDEAEEANLEEEAGGEPPLLQVGEYVEYRTAQSGPHNQSYVGSGRLISITPHLLIVESAPGQRVLIDIRTDVIRRVASPS